jgi:TolB protein
MQGRALHEKWKIKVRSDEMTVAHELAKEKVAFVNARGQQLYIVDADGSMMIRPTLQAARSDVSWSPDGDRLVYVIDSMLYTIGADGSELTRITDPSMQAGNPAWSPGGDRITFDLAAANFNKHVCTINSDGTSMAQLTTGDHINESPVWSPDGKQIAFRSNRDGGPDRTFDVFVMKADGSSVKRVSRKAMPNRDLAWSPDGRWIAFTANPGDNWDVFIVSPDGAELLNLTAGDDPRQYHIGTGCWSPDSDRLAFWENLQQTIGIVGLPGGSVLKAFGFGDQHPCWSSDGSRIFFQSGGSLVAMNADGTELTDLSTEPILWPICSPGKPT